MALVLITPPAVEPVLLQDAKDFLRIDGTQDDTLLPGLITAARSWCEVYTQRRFITQTVRLSLDFFPGYIDPRLTGHNTAPFFSGTSLFTAGLRYGIAVPYPPLQSIAAFRYQDGNGNWQNVLPTTGYILDTSSSPGRLMPPFGQFWPLSRVVQNAIQIDFVCGYGNDQSSVPQGIQVGIKLLLAHWYENRVPDESDIPLAVKSVLSPFRDWRP